MEETKCSETSAYKIQTPGNYPEENIQQPRRYHFPVVYQAQFHEDVWITWRTAPHIHNVINSEWVYARGVQLDDFRKR